MGVSMASSSVDQSVDVATRMYQMFDRDAVFLARRQLERIDAGAERATWGVIHRHLMFMVAADQMVRL